MKNGTTEPELALTSVNARMLRGKVDDLPMSYRANENFTRIVASNRRYDSAPNERADRTSLRSVEIDRHAHILRTNSHALSVETRSNVARPEESLESSNKHVELRESSSYRSVLSFLPSSASRNRSNRLNRRTLKNRSIASRSNRRFTVCFVVTSFRTLV